MSPGSKNQLSKNKTVAILLAVSLFAPVIGLSKTSSANAAPQPVTNITSKSKVKSDSKNKSNPSTTTALELIQVHALAGPQRVLISPIGLRLENPNTGLVIINPAPFNEAIWTNPKKKLYYKIASNKSMGRMDSVKYVLDTTSEFTEIPWESPKETTLMGRSALVYAKHTPKKSWCKYWVLNDFKVSQKVLKLCCTFSGSLPMLAGVPLQWHQYVTKEDMFNEIEENPQPQLRKFFETKSIKELTVPVSTFACPEGYKLTTERNDVMSSSVGFGSYKDLLKSPDFLFQSSTKKLNGPTTPEDSVKKEKPKAAPSGK